MKRFIMLLAIAITTALHALRGQDVAIKTNILADAFLNPNAGIEIGLAPKWTLDVTGQLNAWTLSHNRRWKHWLIQPEARYWFCDRFSGHFIGVHLHGGQYNIGGFNGGINLAGTDNRKLRDTRINESSYKAEISGSSVLGTLVNHLNKPISRPYIADNDGCNPQNAYLVWQDANGLLRPSYTWDWDPNEIKKCPTYIKEAYGGKGGIRFYVAPESIKQGNAVIAVSDKAPVVTDAGQGKFDFPEAIWSWHIWVTRLDVDDADKTIAVTNHDNNIKLDLMPMNLGQSIIFPQSGYRDWDDKSNTYHFNRIGYIWTSGSANLDSNKSFNLEFSRTDRNGYIHPLNPFYPCDGFTVRPLHKIRRSDP